MPYCAKFNHALSESSSNIARSAAQHSLLLVTAEPLFLSKALSINSHHAAISFLLVNRHVAVKNINPQQAEKHLHCEMI